jgi:hypothetical protein
MGSELIKTTRTVLLVSLLVAATPRASADIYKCTDEDGNVAYLQLPCPVKKAMPVEPSETDDSDEAVDNIEPEATGPTPAPSSRLPGEPLAQCKKRYRDQIDAVEAELFSADFADQSEAFKERLLVLTQQLRACE